MLALPMLVYVAGLTVPTAIGVSAMIVGVASAAAVVVHARHDNVAWRTGFLLAGAGAPAALAGAHVASSLSPKVLLGSFSVMLLGVALWMFVGTVKPTSTPRRWPLVAAIGSIIGLVAGFFGVGGGFMIVPALVGLAGLEMRRAIGTSLLVIAINSIASFVEHANHNALPLFSAVAFTSMTVAGALIGQQLSMRTSTAHLRKLFAVLVLVVAALVGWRVLSGR